MYAIYEGSKCGKQAGVAWQVLDSIIQCHFLPTISLTTLLLSCHFLPTISLMTLLLSPPGWIKRAGGGISVDHSPTSNITCPHGDLLPQSATLLSSMRRVIVPSRVWAFIKMLWEAEAEAADEKKRAAMAVKAAAAASVAAAAKAVGRGAGAVAPVVDDGDVTIMADIPPSSNGGHSVAPGAEANVNPSGAQGSGAKEGVDHVSNAGASSSDPVVVEDETDASAAGSGAAGVEVTVGRPRQCRPFPVQSSMECQRCVFDVLIRLGPRTCLMLSSSHADEEAVAWFLPFCPLSCFHAPLLFLQMPR